MKKLLTLIIINLFLRSNYQKVERLINNKDFINLFFYLPKKELNSEEISQLANKCEKLKDAKIKKLLPIKFPSPRWLQNNWKIHDFKYSKDKYIEYLNYIEDINKFPEKKIIIIIPSYNNERWTKYCIKSALRQNYNNFEIILIDDFSKDKSLHIATQIQNKYQKKLSIIKNNTRVGKASNVYQTLHNINNNFKIKNDDIILLLDGDDILAHHNVLKIINKIFHLGSWITYGGFVCSEMKLGLTSNINKNDIKTKRIRKMSRHTSQLTSFYAGLYKKINLNELLFNGNFVQMTADLAQMIPMLEMAGEKIYHITFPLYLYNRLNPINDDKVNRQYQDNVDRYIKRLPIKKIKNIFLKTKKIAEYDIFQVNNINQIRHLKKRLINNYTIITPSNSPINNPQAMMEDLQLIKKIKASMLIVANKPENVTINSHLFDGLYQIQNIGILKNNNFKYMIIKNLKQKNNITIKSLISNKNAFLKIRK